MKTKNDHVGRTARQMKRTRAIARVGAGLFSEKGYKETTMDDIARTSRMAKGGIYHYFHSKEEILHFLCSDFVDRRLDDLERALKGIQEGTEQVRCIIDCSVAFCTDNAAAARVMLNESRSLSRRHLKTVRIKESRYREIIMDAVARFAEGRAHRGTATALSFILIGVLDGCCLWYDPKGDVRPEELSRIIFTLFTGKACGLSLAPSLPQRGDRVSKGGLH